MPRKGGRRKQGKANSEASGKIEGEYPDIITGPIKDRRFGLRIDDDIHVLVMAGDHPVEIEGRLLRHTTTALEMVDSEGNYHWISNDWIIKIQLKRHNRPHPKDDPEYKKPKPKKENKVAKGDEDREESTESTYYV